jgi:hypothetical protein
MPTPQERVAAAMQFFFQTALPQATGKNFAQLSNPRVHVGSYVRYSGPPITTSVGQPITPDFALRMSPPVPVAGGAPNPTAAAVPAAGPLWPILWVRQVADAGVDDEAEIRRVMADIDSFSRLFDAAGGPAAGPPAATPGPGAAPAPAPARAGTAPGAHPSPSRHRAAASPGACGDDRAGIDDRAGVAQRVGLGPRRRRQPRRAGRQLVDDRAGSVGARDRGDRRPQPKQTLQHFFTYTSDGTHTSAGAARDAIR